MRHQATDAETRLWSLLRGRRLSGFKFRRQHPVGRYILDFYCVRARLAIELDGGHHAQEGQERHDAERTRELSEQGIRVVRFWNHDVLRQSELVLEEIWRHLQELCEEGRGGS